MRAWIHSRAGPPSTVLSLSSDVPTPTIKKPQDVLVRISYAALNPGASIMMQLCPFIFRSKPVIPELDFSGTLVAAGSSALESGRLAIGDAVFGSVDVGSHVKAGSGALAEFVVVPAANVAKKPNSNATDAEAAGLCVAGCTAVELMEKAGLQNGNSVLVNGASGGIGTMIVQMARDAVGSNGRVVAICSAKNADMVKELGADEVRHLLHLLGSSLVHYASLLSDAIILTIILTGYRLPGLSSNFNLPRQTLRKSTLQRNHRCLWGARDLQ
jgi:NADPH:quinone reductase-like Zn-dependent oxidoreductase